MHTDPFPQMICPDCYGQGIVYIMIECGRPMNYCCGGCTRDQRCETCDGTGSIDDDSAID